MVALVDAYWNSSSHGIDALKPLVGGLKLVTLPSPWWSVQKIGLALDVSQGTMAMVISRLWLIALIVVAV